MGVDATDSVVDVGDPLLRRPVDAGRDVAIGQIYRAHRSRLVHLAAAITLDRSLAEEVMHDAFVGLQRRRDLVDDPPVAADVVNPEIDETWAAVTELPSRERAVVVLRFWLDLSEADIAASLGWPAGTVKSTLHRALKRLKKDLGE